VAKQILEDVGIEPRRGIDEAQAYLVQYITEMVVDGLNNHKSIQ